MLNIIFAAITIYLFINFFSRFYNLVFSNGYKKLLVKNKYQEAKFAQHISVVVYAQNDEENIADVIQKLIRQDYSKEKYKINIILDNCDDDSSKLAEIVGGAYIYRINSEDKKPIGKEAAYSWFLSKVDTYEYTNLYLFLTADMKFGEDFLTQINKSSFYYDAITGKTEYTYSNTSNLSISIKNKTVENLEYKPYSVTGFASYLDFNFLAIKQDVAEKISLIDLFKKSKFELTFAMLKNNIKFFYSEKLSVTKTKIYPSKIEATSRYHNIKSVTKFSNLNTNLLYLYQFLPNSVSVVLLISFLNFAAFMTYNYYFINAVSVINILYSIYFISVIAKSKFTLEDLYRVISFKLNLNKYFNFSKIINDLKSKIKFTLPDKAKESFDVIVTNGSKDLICKLVLEEENPYKYNFSFKRRKMKTKPDFKKTDALQSVIDKLNEKGFTMKICQNCGFYEPLENISHSTSYGFCYANVINKTNKDPQEVNICYSCKKIIPKDAKEVILSHINKD